MPGARRAGRPAHRRRQVRRLPGAGAAAAGPDARHLPAARAAAGPDRRPQRARRPGALAAVRISSAETPGPAARRRSRRCARARRGSCSSPRSSSPTRSGWREIRALRAGAGRGRRGALPLRLGSRLPARLPAARASSSRELGRPAGAWRSPPPRRRRYARTSSTGSACATPRSSSPAWTGPTCTWRRRTAPTRSTAGGGCWPRCGQEPTPPGIVYVPTRRAAEELAERLADGRARRATAYHGGMAAGDARTPPRGVPRRPGAGHGGDLRLRHGHRQAGHPLGRPHGAARLAGQLPAGDRPGRPRRRSRRRRCCSTGPRTSALQRYFTSGAPGRTEIRDLVAALRHRPHTRRALRERSGLGAAQAQPAAVACWSRSAPSSPAPDGKLRRPAVRAGAAGGRRRWRWPRSSGTRRCSARAST